MLSNGGALVQQDRCLYKKRKRHPGCACTEERQREDTERTTYKLRRQALEETSPASTSILDSQPPELLFKPPSCGILLWQVLQRNPPFSGCRHLGRENCRAWKDIDVQNVGQDSRRCHPKYSGVKRKLIELPSQNISIIEITPKYPVWSLCGSVAAKGEEIQTVDEGFIFI